MTAQIIRPARFNRGSPIRAVHPVDECLAALQLVSLRTGVNAAEATAEDLERLHDAVLDFIAEKNGGVR